MSSSNRFKGSKNFIIFIIVIFPIDEVIVSPHKIRRTKRRSFLFDLSSVILGFVIYFPIDFMVVY